ncbi:MAG: hypothetical protein N3A61_04405, partial [Ignavibacteria bacterium]|nr:hypothetical protein [Ignavibacteria bacterium]
MTGGNEFRVNTFTDSTQREPVAAADNNGNYVVVWTSTSQDGSEGGIYAQRFNANDQKVGSEFKVNTTTLKNQYRPAVDMNSSGRFVVVWSSMVDLISSYDVFAQMYDNAGNKVGGEILVNTYTTYSQNYADVAIDDNGNFCVVWQSWNQDGSDKGIYAQRFSSNGTKVGTEFRVNTTTQFSQGRPSIDMTPTGNFVVVWESWNQDSASPSSYGMYGQRFSADGTKLGSEFQINSYTNDYQWYGDVAVRADGNFIVAWCSWRQDGHDGGIFFQRFNSNGEKVGNEIQVNTTTAYYQWLPKIDLFNNNSFVIVWSSWKQDGSREGVYGKVFNSEGIALTLEFRVNDFTGSYQWEPSVIAGNNYELLVVWSSWNQVEGKDYDVFAKRFRPNFPQGRINESSISHPSGISTAKIKVHLFDSTLTLGEQYRVSFFVKSKDSIYASIKNVTRDSFRVQNFALDRGLNQFYLTNVFDGIAVEFNPVYTLSLDVN